MGALRDSATNVDEINTLINKIDFTAKNDAKCNTLSGRQKRKLCVV